MWASWSAIASHWAFSMRPLVLGETRQTLIVICEVWTAVYSQCGRPQREQSWMWNLLCACWLGQTVRPLATTQESVRIWIMNLPSLRESSSAKVTNLWIPILYQLSLSNGIEKKQPPVHSITCDGVALVHKMNGFPFSWTRDPANDQEDQGRDDLSWTHGLGQGDSRKHEN